MVAYAQRLTAPLDPEIRHLLVERAAAPKNRVLRQQAVTSDFQKTMETGVSVLTLFKTGPMNDNDALYADLCQRIQNNPQWKIAAAEQLTAKDNDALPDTLSPAMERPLVAEPRLERIKKTRIELKILHDYIVKAGMTLAQATDFLSFVTEKQVEKFLVQDAAKDGITPELAKEPEPDLNFLATKKLQESIGDLLPDAKVKAHPAMDGQAKVRPLHPQMAAFGENLQQVAPASPVATVKPVSHDAHVESELDFIAKSTDHDLDPALARQALALTQPQTAEQTVVQAALLGQAVGVPVAAGAAAPVASGGAIERPPGNDGKALDVVKEAKKQKMDSLLRDNKSAYLSPTYVDFGYRSVKVERRHVPLDFKQNVTDNNQVTIKDLATNSDQVIKKVVEGHDDGMKDQVNTLSTHMDRKVLWQDYHGNIKHIGQPNNKDLTHVVGVKKLIEQNKEDTLFQANNTRRMSGLSVTAA